MKYALIGCGRIAVNHLKVVVNNDLDLVALCDLKLENIDLLLSKVGFDKSVEKYVDYKKMIQEHPEIELVAIATDSGVHAEIAIFCLEHGKNVIVEKPMAMSIADAKKMIEIAEQKGLKLSVCHQNRFNIAVQKTREALESGRFGNLSHGSINVRWSRNQDYYTQAPWRGKWLSDGGALMNQCIHGIDLLRWMFGDDIEMVYGAINQRFHKYLECEDIGVAVVKFKNGAVATIEGTTNVFPKNLEETLYIFGENATVKLGGKSCNNIDVWDFKDEKSGDNENRGLNEPTSNVYGNGHTSLYADVIDAIKNNRNPYVDGLAGLRALELVLAIYKSQLEGKPVKLPLDSFSTKEMLGLFKDKN